MLTALSALPVLVSAHPDLDIQIQHLNQQIETGPATVDMYLKRGDLYRRHEDLPTAARDFAAARQLSPDNPLIDFYDGRLFLESGDPASAEVHLARYLAAEPHHAKAWVLRGKANVQMNQPENAAGHFTQAIENTKSRSPELFRLQIFSTLAIDKDHW
jgi:predicted Zn-dependent protease